VRTSLAFLYLIILSNIVRLPRKTYEGVSHHALNFGYEGRPISRSAIDEKFFLAL
jgi:hypothetical protein